MKKDIRKVGKVHSWIELLIYFLVPLLLVIAFNQDLLTASGGESGFMGYNEEISILMLLGFLFFIALMLERFIEVLINTTRKPDQIKYEASTVSHQQDLERLKKQSADVREILDELNELNGKIRGMETQEEYMQSRNSSQLYAAPEQPKVDEKISEMKGYRVNCEVRKEEISSIVEETYRPILKKEIKRLFQVKGGSESNSSGSSKSFSKGEKKDVAILADFEKEYGFDSATPSVILRNILRVNREILEHDRTVIEELKRISASYKVETRIIAIRLAFASGILISLIGFRTLEPLISWGPDLTVRNMASWQAIAFMWTDVMLTGGVIAGGSEGIHKIANAFGSFIDRTNNRIEESAV